MQAETANKSENMSPWPDVDNKAITFLLDVRDDFEAKLLRDLVEGQRPESATTQYSFIRLPKGRAGTLLGEL